MAATLPQPRTRIECPECAKPSVAIHSQYTSHVADLLSSVLCPPPNAFACAQVLEVRVPFFLFIHLDAACG